MSSYSMTLQNVIELLTYGLDTTDIDDRIEQGRQILFNFDYPIWDETARVAFETDFINNFYMREIGFETEGLFKFRLKNWLKLNMPYWNKMYESTLLEYDPLSNNKTHTSHTQTNTGNTSNTNNGTNTGNDSTFSRNLQSNNPDSRLSITPNADGSGTIEYASGIIEDKQTDTSSSTSSNTGSTTANANETFTQDRSGKIGVQTYGKMIQEHRQAMIKIEPMIFKDMNELFMLVY